MLGMHLRHKRQLVSILVKQNQKNNLSNYWQNQNIKVFAEQLAAGDLTRQDLLSLIDKPTDLKGLKDFVHNVLCERQQEEEFKHKRSVQVDDWIANNSPNKIDPLKMNYTRDYLTQFSGKKMSTKDAKELSLP